MALDSDSLVRSADDELLLHIGDCVRTLMENAFESCALEPALKTQHEHLSDPQEEKRRALEEAGRRQLILVSDELANGWFLCNSKRKAINNAIGTGMVCSTLRDAWMIWRGMGKPAQTVGVRNCQLSAFDQGKGRRPFSTDGLMFQLGLLRSIPKPTRSEKARAEELAMKALQAGELAPPYMQLKTWHLVGKPRMGRFPDSQKSLEFADLDACWRYWHGLGRPYGTSAQQKINMRKCDSHLI